MKKCPTLFSHTDSSDEEEAGNSSDEETDDTPPKKKFKKSEDVDGVAENIDFNATTCLYPKEPESDMVINHSNKKKKIKLKRKDQKPYIYAPGEKQLPTNWVREKN